MSLFNRIGRLWHQVVTWFRADAGGTAAPIPIPKAAPPLELFTPPEPPLIPAAPIPIFEVPRVPRASPPTAPEGLPVQPSPPPLHFEAPLAPPPTPEEETVRPARRDRRRREALRRKLERARLKHDEWVTPGGPEPVKHTRQPSTREPPTPGPLPVLFDDPNDIVIGDEWMQDDGEGPVLYEETEFYGAFNFRDTILRQLERYWIYIERMQKHDPDAYGFYKQVGATLLPYLATRTNRKPNLHKLVGQELEELKEDIFLTPWFKQHWPTFGCISTGTNPHDEQFEQTCLNGRLWTPKFLYFVRYQNIPWYVERRRGGKFYMLTVWWDRPDKKRLHWGIPNTFPIWISDDGNTIRALKTRERINGSIRPEYDWRIPHDYKLWAKQHGLDVQTHLTHIFCLAARQIEQSHYATCRVAVEKDDTTAVFGIEPQRCPYFFKDRDVTLDKHGRKQRVFHSVRPYTRADGRTVPLQFRGLREFEWASYHVSITVPGRDHFFFADLDIPAVSLPPKAHYKKTDMRDSEIGALLKEKIRTGHGAWVG